MPNRSAARSLYVADGRIYVGAVGELGYLDSDEAGKLRYTSLLKNIPKEYRDFKDVYTTHVIGDTIYFRTRYTIFRWTDNQMRIWKSSKQLMGAFVVNDKFYSGQIGVGLMEMVDDSLQLLPGGEMFANKSVRFMIPSYGGSQILIGTLANGLFLYDGTGIKSFSTSIDDFLSKNQVRDAANLPGNLIALATARGVVIFDQAGKFCQVVNKASGLRDELVISVFVDHQRGLWMGLNNGIARVETSAPISRFQSKSGIGSFVDSIVRHRGVLYTTTDRGVRYLDTRAEPFSVFRAVEGISTLSWSLMSVEKGLLVGTQKAIFSVVGTKATKLNELSAITLYRSGQDSSKIFAGLLDGLAVMQWVDDNWVTLGKVRDINERIISMTEDKNGRLWVGTRSQSILKINQDFTTSSDGQFQMNVTRFGKEHGLPEGPVSPTIIGDRLFFRTWKGLKHFDMNQGMFEPDSTFGAVFADTLTWMNDLREDSHGNVWIIAGRGDKKYTGRAVRLEDRTYGWEETPFLRMHDLGNVRFSYPENNGTVWFGGSEGIARYVPDIPKNYQKAYATVIRRVNGISTDSVFYHGASLFQLPQPEIEHKNNSLRFQFAALSYDDPSANLYQVKLYGFDADWSNWSNEKKKDYTSLPAGDYTFRVRAKNVYEHLSREGIFSFTILPPWYQTWWAFIFYAFFAATIVFAIVKSRVRHFEKKTRELETIVAERTCVIREQAEKLQELDKVKSRFFANISHEFRTPLTLILGPLEDRIAKARKKADKDEFGMMHRSANRLLRLVNQLLDLSRLESAKMKLTASRGDFQVFLKRIVLSFASLAEQKKITLQFKPCKDLKPSHGLPEVYFDADKIEKIFMNLLSNALKFTREGGNVTVSVSVHNSTLNPFPKKDSEASHLWEPIQSSSAENGSHIGTGAAIQVTVQDTGVGIPEDRLPRIFDRFYQVDDTSTRIREGTGIGLALAKELVALHHGEIAVESQVGKGTTFKVTLPLGRAHLGEDEIDARPSLETPKNVRAAKEVSPPALVPGDDNATVILIVEDNADMRRYIREHLQTDYQILEAGDGREGLGIALEVIPDLVISDIMMPELDGQQLCKELKTDEKTSHIPVILLTAKAGEESKLAGLETGTDDYLTKPFNARELRTRVRNLIEQRRRLRKRFLREGILQPREVAVTSVDEAFLHKIMSEVEANLADEDFGVEALSLRVSMSTRQLHRKILALTERTPVELIRSVRLQRSHQLLVQQAGTVSEIAYQVGFTNLSYFARMFKEAFGKLPSEI